MNYPLISDYIEAIKSAEDNFEELSYLRPVLGDDGLPVMTSGNFAVVFKMKDEQSGKFYAVKCFTKEQEGRAEAYREIAKELENVSSPYILSIRYLDKELFVDTDQTTETEFPVLLMDWVEGKTLDKYLRENLDDKYALEMLAYRFSQLAQWLIPQPFAHGDLKPDNILVHEDGTLVLVDYDGMYVPTMKGQKARELGSPDFCHPQRNEDDFNEHIDDFSIVSILLSLKEISINPHSLDKYGSNDRLLLSKNDYCRRSKSIILSYLFLSDDKDIIRLLSYLILFLIDKNEVVNIDLSFSKPAINENTIANVYDINLGFYDEENLLTYSVDGKRLLCYGYGNECYDHILECFIKEGTRIICDNAFYNNEVPPPIIIHLPQSLIKIGKDAFTSRFVPSLSYLIVPSGYFDYYKTIMPEYEFLLLEIPDSSMKLVDFLFFAQKLDEKLFNGIEDGNGFLYDKNKRWLLRGSDIETEEYTIEEGVIRIDHHAFCKSNIKRITIPSSVKYIGDSVFDECNNLEEVHFKGMPKICGNMFFQCHMLNRIFIPSGTMDFFINELNGYRDFLVENI